MFRNNIFHIFYSGAPAAPRAAKRSPILNMHRKEKETHELIFSWLSWLAVLLVGAYARRRRRRSCPTWRPYSKKETYSLSLPRTSLILDIPAMINWHLSKQYHANQYHVTISRTQVYSSSRSRVLLVFRLDRGLMSGKLVDNRARLFWAGLRIKN